jgi:hypothetical protein
VTTVGGVYGRGVKVTGFHHLVLRLKYVERFPRSPPPPIRLHSLDLTHGQLYVCFPEPRVSVHLLEEQRCTSSLQFGLSRDSDVDRYAVIRTLLHLTSYRGMRLCL